MKKVRQLTAFLLIAVLLLMPLTAFAGEAYDETGYEEVSLVEVLELFRTIDGVEFSQLRGMLNAFGLDVSWDRNLQAVVVSFDDFGTSEVVFVEEVGGFIEDGISWVPTDYLNFVLLPALFTPPVVPRVEPINPNLWNVENFEEVREASFSTELEHGEIALEFTRYMSNNIGARSAFTYRELDAAIWIVEELLAMGYDFADIEIQEFSYWDVRENGVDSFAPFMWMGWGHSYVVGPYTDYLREDRLTQNVVLTVPGVSDQVIVVGAHYDSPPYASASDNASGTALLLESAQRMLELDNYYTIVYVFFAAEEVGLLGATWYLDSLSQVERDNILMMVNADVLIEGPFVIYGAGAMPRVDEADIDVLIDQIVYSMMDNFADMFESLMSEVLEEGLDPIEFLGFDTLEGLVEFYITILLDGGVETVTIIAGELGIIGPYISEVAAQVSEIAAELTVNNNFELISIPEAVAFPTDSLVFLFDGFTVVNLVGLEYINAPSLTPGLVAQLTRLGTGFDHEEYGFLTATILHTPLDEFYFIEETWPGMMLANLHALGLFLEAILTSTFN